MYLLNTNSLYCYLIVSTFLFSCVIRLGLFLVYTLPPCSEKSEGTDILDGELSNDMSGKRLKKCLYVIYGNLSLIQICFLCSVAQGSGPANIICIRNKMLLVLSEVLKSDNLQKK